MIKDFKNNVSGIITVRVTESEWNNSWDEGGLPRKTPTNLLYATGYSLSHLHKIFERDYLNNLVFNQKSYNKDYSIMTLTQHFDSLEPDLKDSFDKKDILNRLLKYSDVRKYGLAFTKEKCSLSLRNIISINYGVNKLKNSRVQKLDIIAQFASEENKGQSTKGTEIMIDEALFSYNFNIMPNNRNEFKEYLDKKNSFNEKDYEDFKESACKAVSLYKSTSKRNCYNEVSLFIKYKERCKIWTPNLTRMYNIKKEGDINFYDFDKVNHFLKDNIEEIEIIEYYSNPYFTEDNLLKDDKITRYNIMNMKVR